MDVSCFFSIVLLPTHRLRWTFTRTQHSRHLLLRRRRLLCMLSHNMAHAPLGWLVPVLFFMQSPPPSADEDELQIVLRLRVPDSHSDCPLGEKYGAAEEACSHLVSE